MKVLHVINSLHFGGAEKLILDTVPEFKSQGIDVEVMVLYNERTFFFKELEERHKVRVIAPKKRRSLYSFYHVLWIRKYIKEYDLIHVHIFPSIYWVALATLFLKNKPILITTEHNTKNRRRTSLFFKYIDAFIYKKYSSIIAISEGVKKNIQAHLGKSSSKVELINNGVNIASFQKSLGYPKSKFNVPEDTKIVLQVASFTAQKDQDTLLKAVALLPKYVHLFLVGSGVLIEEKKKLSRDLKIEDRVHFLGYRTDVAQLFKTVDVCVLSSHYEGFGLSIVEGMASGLPCIGSNVDGLSQIIGNAGLLFEPENHIQLKEKLNQLFSNKEYYNKISKRCEDRAKEYDISFMIDAHIDLYKKLKPLSR